MWLEATRKKSCTDKLHKQPVVLACWAVLLKLVLTKENGVLILICNIEHPMDTEKTAITHHCSILHRWLTKFQIIGIFVQN